MGLFGRKDDDDTKKRTDHDGKLFLREEKLDISKNRVQTGEVNVQRDVIEELKSVDVPVSHEEVVIQRRAINHEDSDEPIRGDENIRIPVSEERVNVGKHTVITGAVMASKREVEDTRRIEETLKREEAHVHSSGGANIVSDDEDMDRLR